MPNTLSPNMSLILPTVGQEPGPNWALDLNNSLSIIDQHNHAPGNGAPITSASLDINIDLPFNNNNAISLRSVRFQPQLTPLSSGLDVGCLYVSGQDLYYNDVSGGQIQITANGFVNSATGNITNLIPPAAITYVPATQTFLFESNQGNSTPASLDGGNLYLRNIIPASNYVQIQPNAVLPASYSLTLPSALPASTSVLLLDNLGNIATSGTATALSVTTLNSTTVNASTANLTSSLAIKNDTGLLQFRNTADSVQFASITGSSSGLTLNLPDTADSYTFQVNGVTKGSITNSGMDAQYLYNLNVPATSLPAVPLTTISWGTVSGPLATGASATITLASGSVTTTSAGRVIFQNLTGGAISGSGIYGTIYCTVNGVVPDNFYYATSAGTYSVVAYASVTNGLGAPSSYNISPGSYQFVVLPG